MKTLLACAALLLTASVAIVADDLDADANVAIVKQMFDAFNQHDWDKMASYYSDDASFLDPTLGAAEVKQSHADIVRKYSGLEKMAPDIFDDIKHIHAAGNTVIVEFVSSGSAPDGSKWTLPICTVLTLADGKIVRDATYFDK